MYTGLLHTHRTFALLFLILYVVKLVLLLMNKSEILETVTKKSKIPEMVINTLFLVSGIGMLFMIGEISPLLIIKVVLVLAAIPLAVIGFRRSNKLLATLSVVLVIAVYGLGEMNKVGVDDTPLASTIVANASDASYNAVQHGKALYERNCVVCHGPNGDLQGSGAKNLITSQLSETETRDRIVNGKNAMVGYGDLYSEEEISAVFAYVMSLRQ